MKFLPFAAQAFWVHLEWWIYPALFVAAVIAGLVDAVAGGGGLIALPALLTAGFPVPLALGTNKLQSVFGSGMAAWHYAQRADRLAGVSDWDRGDVSWCAGGSVDGAADRCVVAGAVRTVALGCDFDLHLFPTGTRNGKTSGEAGRGVFSSRQGWGWDFTTGFSVRARVRFGRWRWCCCWVRIFWRRRRRRKS